MPLASFVSTVKRAQAIYFPEADLQMYEESVFYIKIRIVISKTDFVSIRYNQRNKSQGFAYVRRNKRIAGYDNLGGWHLHPFRNPDEHQTCQKPTIEQVFRYFRQRK